MDYTLENIIPHPCILVTDDLKILINWINKGTMDCYYFIVRILNFKFIVVN